MRKPKTVASVLSNPLQLKYFNEFLQMTSNPLFLIGYKKLLTFKLFSKTEDFAKQRQAAKQLLIIMKQLG